LGVTDIGLRGEDSVVERLDLLGRLGEIVRGGHGVRHGADLLADVDGDDVGALLGEPDGMAAALPACRAGDECDFALKLSHAEFPSLVYSVPVPVREPVARPERHRSGALRQWVT
jgi:hypothetical protein